MFVKESNFVFYDTDDPSVHALEQLGFDYVHCFELPETDR